MDLQVQDAFEPVDPTRVAVLNGRLPQEQLDALAVEFGLNIVATPSGLPHTHPRAAMERHVAYAAATRQACRMAELVGSRHVVGDIGGRPRWHAYFTPGGRVHSMCPVLDARDVVAATAANERASSCAHKAQDCDCHRFSALIAVHALHHLPLDDFVKLLCETDTQTAFVATHRFSGLTGRLCKGELHYTRDTATTVVCTLADGTTYQHDAMDWLEQPSIPLSGGKTLSTQVLQRFGDTYVYVISVMQRETPASLPRVWESAVLMDGDAAAGTLYRLPHVMTKGSRNDVKLVNVIVPAAHLRVYRHVTLLCSDEDEHVAISTDILFEVATHFAGKPRTPGLLQDVMHSVRQHYARIGNLPSATLHSAVMVTSVLAFTLGMERETMLLSVTARDTERLRAAHTSAVGFQPHTTLTQRAAAYVAALCGFTATFSIHAVWGVAYGLGASVAAGFSSLFASAPHVVVAHHTAVSTMLGATASATTASVAFSAAPIIVPALVASAYYGWYHYRPDGREFDDHLRFTRDDASYYRTTVSVPLYTERAIEFAPTDKLNSKEVPQDPEGYVETKYFSIGREQRPALRGPGLCFDYRPTYFPSTAEAERVALESRTNRLTPAPLRGAWQELVIWFWAAEIGARWRAGTEFQYRLDRMMVESFVSKFPPDKRAVLEDAWDQLVDDGMTIKGVYRNSAFVKREKHHSKLDLSAPFDTEGASVPRAIISFDPRFTVLLGTIYMQLFEAKHSIYRKWKADLGHPPPWIPPGLGGEELGAWFTHWYVTYRDSGGAVFWVCDNNRHDAHVSRDSTSAADDVNFRFGRLPDCVAPILKAARTAKGTTHHGVGFKQPDSKMASGRADTSITNTCITERQQEFSFEADKRGDWAGAADGDDGLCIISVAHLAYLEAQNGENRRPDFPNHDALKLGITAEGYFTKTLVAVEFCSRRFYPTAEGFLPGGKIGRVLSRAGWFLTGEDSQTVRSAALGQLQDNFHVPFLREYFARVCQLAAKRLGGRPQAHSIHMAKRHDYDDSTLSFVEQVYGLTKQDLADFVGLLLAVQSLPVVVHWPKLIHCCEVDA